MLTSDSPRLPDVLILFCSHGDHSKSNKPKNRNPVLHVRLYVSVYFFHDVCSLCGFLLHPKLPLRENTTTQCSFHILSSITVVVYCKNITLDSVKLNPPSHWIQCGHCCNRNSVKQSIGYNMWLLFNLSRPSDHELQCLLSLQAASDTVTAVAD